MKIGIIGAGASGLMAAVAAAKCGAAVTVFERNEKVGKKILVTGNGKCNFTNLDMDELHYNESARKFVKNALSSFNEKDTVQFFKNAGLFSKEKSGYMYPYSEQAQAVQDIFIMECAKYGVEIKKGIMITSVTKKKKSFMVSADGLDEYFDRIIVACGGMAMPKSGSDGNGYDIARSFGHNIIKPVPALAQLVCSDRFFKELSGVRCECSIDFYINGRFDLSESGEVQFADYGLSGIPVFQYSGKALKAIEDKKKVSAGIDFMPDINLEDLRSMLMSRRKKSGNKTVMEYMIGLLNWNVNKVILKLAGISPSKKASQLDNSEVEKIAELIKGLKADITGSNGFDRAQVTAGGINTAELSDKMESNLMPGLYFAGEIIDVDGRCGGYNLQWAWTSGYIAGKAAAND